MFICQGNVEKGGEGEGRRRREEEPRALAMPLVIFCPLAVRAL
jgi:hypothetical protein